MRSVLRFLAFALVLVLALVVFYFFQRERSTPHEGSLHTLQALDNEITALVNRVVPSVVSISVRVDNGPQDRMQWLRQLVGIAQPQVADPQLGSGVIVSSEGHILTNVHVIAGATRVEVQLNDGRMYLARFLGADEQADIAVLKIDETGLPALPFADSNNVSVGQIVFAIGNPLGLQETVTQGIISGKGRRAVSAVSADFFQTDAAINPGNSGGPLVNVRGEIVGISNSVLLDSTGISFAIPSNLAMRVFDDVVKRGKISRPWFGAFTWPLNDQIASELGVGTKTGNLVISVVEGSPAEQAGIRPGDVLKEFDGQPVRDSVDIRNRIAEMKEGDKVEVTLWRAGKLEKVQVVVAPQPWRERGG